MKNIVVAYDLRRGIGQNGDLPWGRSLACDLKHFKKITTGKTVIMGRKTYESIGRPLPHRQNIVVSRTMQPCDGIEVARSLDEAYALAEHECMIIGGGQLYQEALPDCDVVYATEVDETFPDADTFFPFLGRAWHEVERVRVEKCSENNDTSLSFVTYRRHRH